MEIKHSFVTCQIPLLFPLCLLALVGALKGDAVTCHLSKVRQESKKVFKVQRHFSVEVGVILIRKGEVFEMGRFLKNFYWQFA